MNNNNELFTVAVDDLRQQGRLAFQGLGLGPTAAEQVSNVLVLADLFGLTTHGLSRIESYGERLECGGISASAEPAMETLAPAIARIDGRNAVGPLVGMAALETGMKMARQFGIGLVLARGSNHFGPVSPYSYIAAEQGFASIIGSNATTTISPSGGSDARLGNSPLGFGVPNPDGNHFMLDMAMSVVARAKIRNALTRGERIPDNWATDANGKPTTDPRAALDGFLLPIGGHKGYGLALVVDLLAGLLSNAAYLTHVKSWVDAPDQPQNLGHFFILIDTARLGSPDWLQGRMTDFASILHQSPAVEPTSPVIVPGEIELKKMHRHMREGVPVDATTQRLLDLYASRVA
ncbi:Ldh family oxidoreductase [Pseudomonas thivervalensis]|uniref:Hydroxyacid dehydrogenase n=1 Tax=Pseudomonas thivervalensis TaxID=86265 RepID=A0A2Z4Z881_9PSED|nr:Ldh family oxidoreductase [Pseudomonas thivervalensis]AXA54227.1 hydroxyacid dehydrogenase [Pseudomonas thivervalensis]AXA59907.1 hydroxyacid dehydrogenase [Pseudomonas thivervalensis]